MSQKQPLSRDAVLDAAIAVADAGGLAAISMRKVGAQLGVEAMSLYHHVPNKAALLDAIVDRVFEWIELPDPAEPWRLAIRNRASSARSVLGAHPWAIGLIESRPNPGPVTLAAHEAFLETLCSQGFSLRLAASAFSLVDAYVFGFVINESSLPFEGGGQAEELAGQMAASLPLERFPRMGEYLSEVVLGGDYDFGDEFEVGLEIILDQLEIRLAATPPRPNTP